MWGGGVYMFIRVCIHVYMCVYVYICIYTHTPHIFFIHSSINGHLGSFHTLAIVDSAAVNMGVHVPPSKQHPCIPWINA